MALTPAQLPILKAAIFSETDPAFVASREAGATGEMKDFFNTDSTFVVWKTRLHEQERTSLTSSEGTVWSWPAFIARSPGEQAGWQRMFNGTYTINPSPPQVRTGIADVFSGAAIKLTDQPAITCRVSKLVPETYASGGTHRVSTLAVSL